MSGPCLALVQGRDANGQSFRNAAIFDNVSAGGAYMRCKSDVPVGHSIFVVFALATPHSSFASIAKDGSAKEVGSMAHGATTHGPNSHGPKIAARGVVRRVDRHPDGAYGVAVMFSQRRFL